MNKLSYGDNLEVLRKSIATESVDLCYIDPPFMSSRNYNQIYNNIGNEDRAQAIAFMDTWVWDARANEGFTEILANERGRFTVQTVDLIRGLQPVLKKGSLFAYLVSMTLRITEIWRVLKPTGSFYLHCDPTASHYLKLVIDAIFVPNGGHFINEIAWCYSQGGRSKEWFPRKHDIIFWYAKGTKWTFNSEAIRVEYELLSEKSQTSFTKTDEEGRKYKEIYGPGKKRLYKYYEDAGKVPYDWWTDIHQMTGRTAASGNEYLGYPTQKPEALLERIIQASSNEGDTVLDAYCGCGTTIAVAEHLGRKWIGIDITYQSIALILRRLEGKYGRAFVKAIIPDGIPRDMGAACALARRKDDRLRKEFEKWAVLTYTNNGAIINEKKGGDLGIDGVAFFLKNHDDNGKIVFQVKSGHVERGDIAKFNSDRCREGAEMGIFLTLEPPTQGMRTEASTVGIYQYPLMNRSYLRIQLVTIEEMLEQGKRLEGHPIRFSNQMGTPLEFPLLQDVLREAVAVSTASQGTLFDEGVA